MKSMFSLIYLVSAVAAAQDLKLIADAEFGGIKLWVLGIGVVVAIAGAAWYFLVYKKPKG